MIRKLTIVIGMILIIFVFSQVAQVLVKGTEGDCGFSQLKTTRFSHFDKDLKVVPQYPPAAKASGITGTVQVRILINKDGLVEKTCPNYVKGEPKPDRSLVIAAEAAALQWKYPKNFGFPSLPNDLTFDYIEEMLIFYFVLEDSKEKSKER